MPTRRRPAAPAAPASPATRSAAGAPRGRPARAVAASDGPAGTGTLEQQVYDGIVDAVMQRRLAPGARLGEAALCAQHGVSRTVVRQALRRLAETRLVVIEPHRGATVAAPTPQETREVFAARRVIEAAIARLAARLATPSDLQRLQRRLQAEHDALHEGDQARWATLAGGFHLALAELCGNRELQRMLAELMTRCTLMVALYEQPGEAACEHDEHTRLVELLALQDGEAAAALMDRHLLALEARLVVPDAPGPH